ncbi:MAG: hypothetical protein Q6366_012225, partial [Candidatus Freyarchaeota archaeon]
HGDVGHSEQLCHFTRGLELLHGQVYKFRKLINFTLNRSSFQPHLPRPSISIHCLSTSRKWQFAHSGMQWFILI